MIFRYGLFCFLVLLSTVSAPAAGQSIVRTGGGVTVGLTPNLAEAFANDQLCPKRSGISLSARWTVALTEVIQVEALAEEFNGPGRDCISAPEPPIPVTGPYSRIRDFYDARLTDPPTVLALRVGGSFQKPHPLILRPYVGVAQLPGKSLTIPQAGLSVLTGGNPLRILVEVEGWWYSVPKQHLEEEYFDGQLVQRSLTERGIRNFTTIFRFGFTSVVGRG